MTWLRKRPRTTGYYDITALAAGVVAGKILVARSGDVVQLCLEQVKFAAAGQQTIITLPTGLRPTVEQRAETRGFWAAERPNGVELRLTTAGNVIISAAADTVTLNTTDFMFITEQAAPASMPGVKL